MGMTNYKYLSHCFTKLIINYIYLKLVICFIVLYVQSVLVYWYTFFRKEAPPCLDDACTAVHLHHRNLNTGNPDTLKLCEKVGKLFANNSLEGIVFSKELKNKFKYFEELKKFS